MTFQRKMLCAALAAGTLLAATAMTHAATLRIACGTGPGLQHCAETARTWGEQNGHTVETISTPNSATEMLALYQQMLAAGSGDIDLFLIDVVWPGTLAPHMLDLKTHAEAVADEHFQTIIDNNMVDGQLVAMPWWTDAPVLFYRQDLLEQYGEAVPETWEQLTATAETIQQAEREAGNDRFWGYVWQGRAYEGLTCDALEWVASYGGGTIVEPDGSVSINNPRAAAAVDMAKGWLDTISPPGTLNYTEEESRGVFQSGNALFMRNWTYAWALAQGPDSAVRGKVGIAPLPKGGEDGRHAATLGGWQLAVSRYSANPEAAIALALHMTSPEIQKQRAIDLALLPTIEALYEDPEVLEANPFFAEMQPVLNNAVARPSTVTGGRYNQVSSEFFNAVHSVLSGGQSAEQSLAGLESRLNRMNRGGRW